MKIILLQDVKALGKTGDVIEVKDGYARNAILPKGLGVEATAKNINDLKLKKGNEERISQENLTAAQELAAEIAKGEITLAIKVGEGGRTFGSISSKEIAEAVGSQLNIEVDKKKIILKDPIKTLGTHTVAVKIHPKVTGEIKVVVKEEA